MSDNKKYYYLKIKDNFYETEDIKILQAMDNGYLFSDILMKLYLKSLKTDGKLMFKEHIPYNAKMIATITDHNVAIVEKSLGVFSQLGLIEILDNGAIFMLDIQNFIGQSSTEADRKREYRSKIEYERNMNLLEEKVGQMSEKCPTEISETIETTQPNGQMSDISPPELEKEIELEKDIEIDNSISKDILVPKDLVRIQETWNSLGLSQIKSIQGNRSKLLRTRLKEYGMESVLQAIENVRQSSFLKGQNKTSWTIAFDWFIKPNNFPKVLEGNYDDKNNKGPSGSSSSIDNLKELWEESDND
ncbi:phage replisome organizer N-terminal domain-containing protein [Clostridium sp.]|uniref:phage replisome organizer N-terminal domain-containing protein n=1 Tax=Clostridium sp. TaxID=1506 RepID=UPI003217F8D3